MHDVYLSNVIPLITNTLNKHIMGKTYLIDSTTISQRVIRKILTHNKDIVALAFQLAFNVDTECIVLAQVCTWDQKVYIFDLKETPELMHDGHLWRLIEASSLTKVMHDCRLVSQVLTKQFGVILANVYDTQAAYSLMMMQNNLPPRQVTLSSIYKKYGDFTQHRLKDIDQALNKNGLYWSRRPLSRQMMELATALVLPLLPEVYENIHSDLQGEGRNLHQELSDAYIHNKNLQITLLSNFAVTSPNKQRTIVKLKECQKSLLHETIPGSMY